MKNNNLKLSKIIITSIVTIVSMLIISFGMYRFISSSVDIVKLMDKDSISDLMDSHEKTSTYSYISAYYLYGPIAENENDSLYLAVGKDNIYVLKSENAKKLNIPIYNNEMTDEELSKLPLVKITGRTTLMSENYKSVVEETYKKVYESTGVVTENSYEKYWGIYYLDTTTEDVVPDILIILGGIFLFTLVLGIGGKKEEK